MTENGMPPSRLGRGQESRTAPDGSLLAQLLDALYERKVTSRILWLRTHGHMKFAGSARIHYASQDG
jgi:hypothetical protein